MAICDLPPMWPALRAPLRAREGERRIVDWVAVMGWPEKCPARWEPDGASWSFSGGPVPPKRDRGWR